MYYTLETERVYNSIYSYVAKTLGISDQLTQLQITQFSLMPSVIGGSQQEHQNV
jgi:hypothetical protein